MTPKPEQHAPQPEAPATKTETRPLNNAEYLAEAKQFGDFYVKTMESLTGKGELPTPNETKGSGIEAQIVQSLKKHLTEQRVTVMLKHMTTKDILTQAFSADEQQAILENNLDAYRLEEPQPGMYAIFMKDAVFTSLRGEGAQAISVKPKDGVSFLMIREMPDGTSLNLDENYPHEAGHIAWDFIKRDGIVKNDERQPEMKHAFSMYQDELVSKLLSDGRMHSYSHLNVMSREKRQQLRTEQPEVVNEIYQKMDDFNEILTKMKAAMDKTTDIKKQDILLPVFQAQSFSQLRENLGRMEQVISEQPQTITSTNPPGWG